MNAFCRPASCCTQPHRSTKAGSAAPTKPYLDTDKHSTLAYTAAQAVDVGTKAKEAGCAILVPSRSDAAVDWFLDTTEAASGASPSTGLNWIEHTPMARTDQIWRMKKLGCEPSFMINFVLVYGVNWRHNFFGSEHTEFMLQVGAAAMTGRVYSLHSGDPVAKLTMNPLRFAQTSATRHYTLDNSVVGADAALTIRWV